MTAEQLPDALQQTVNALEWISIRADEHKDKIDAIRAEHAQRLTLQHHAADLAQSLAGEQQAHADTRHAHDNIARELFVQRAAQDRRIADLETKCITLKELHDAAADERDALRRGHRSQHDADSAELRRLCADRDTAREERDALRTQISACTPHLRERPDGTLESPSDMLALREREVLGLLGRLSDAQMQGDALRARLAEIETQEPVAWEMWARKKPTDRCLSFGSAIPAGMASRGYVSRPLYARPVPAQAVPESVDGLVSVFSYDEVLTFTFRAESDADKFMARFEPTVDSASREHKA